MTIIYPSSPVSSCSSSSSRSPSRKSTSPSSSPSPSIRISRQRHNSLTSSLKTLKNQNPRTRLYNLPVRLPQPALTPGPSTGLLTKDFLANMRNSLSYVTTRTPSTIPTKDLGSFVAVDTNNGSPSGNFIKPTFCFAVNDGTQDGDSLLYPCHALPVLSLCHNINRAQLTPSSPSLSEYLIPIVPLQLPDPKSFVVLRNYVYNRSQSDLLFHLLPTLRCALPLEWCGDVDQFTMSRALAASSTASALLRLSKHVHGIWGNVCALGISDEYVWSTLQLAWAIVVGAMRMMNGRPSLRAPVMM